MKTRFFLTFICFLIVGENISLLAANLKPGLWHAAITNDSGKEIPFLFEAKTTAGLQSVEIMNGTERLKADEITTEGDSIFIKMPFFDSEFKAILKNDKLSGNWVRHSITGQSLMPFHAEFGQAERFAQAEPLVNMGGRYKITYPGREKYSIGEFIQTSTGIVTGSILNIDGDYRFLEGRVRGDSLYLSTFDGSHCFLFTAKYYTKGDSLGGAKFYMGKSSVRTWSGLKDQNAALPDAYSLTAMKQGVSKLDFAFKNLAGKEISSSDLYFKNKVVIIQFMGSWCPNCMDETAFLSKFYKAHAKNVAVVGLAYERTTDFEKSKISLSNLVRRFKVDYPILITGYTNEPAQVLISMPALNNYIAFPTTIILDRHGKVRKIHTGFSGPGTGKYYTDFEEEFTSLILALSIEPSM